MKKEEITIKLFNNFNKKQPAYSSDDSTMRNLGIKIITDQKDSVSENEALAIPAVAAAVNLISGSIAQLDFYLVKEQQDNKERIENDYRLNLLNKQVNENMDSYTFKKKVVQDMLLHGASHSVIERERNEIKALYLLEATQTVTHVFVKDGYKTSSITEYDPFPNNQNSKPLKFDDYELLSFLKNSDDGLVGNGILRQHQDILSKALNEEKYSSNILKNGAVPIGVLKSQSKLSPQAFSNLKKSWAKLYQGTDQAGKTVILEEGLDYQPVSMNPNDLQLTASKKDTISDIARVFNIPETMLNSNANKYNSAEQNSMHFLHYCLAPIIAEIEAEICKDLLLETEKEQGYSFKMDSSKLLQMTKREKADAIASEYKNGLISFHEARRDLDKNPKTSEDHFRMSLGDVIHKYETDELIIPNTMQAKANIKDNNRAFIEKDPTKELENKDPNQIAREERGLKLEEPYYSAIYDSKIVTGKKNKFIIK